MAGLTGIENLGSARAVRAGRAFIQFSAQDQPVYKAINNLERRFSRFHSGVASRFSRFNSLFSGFAGGLIGGGVVAGVQGLTRSFQGLFNQLNEVARSGAAAKAFGLTPEQFTGVAGVAASVGEQQREFIESLVTLGKVVSEGVSGKGEVAKGFFDTLGISAEEFSKLRLDEQFLGVFDAIRKVETPAARVRALMVAFGEDGGKYLLPLLSKSQDELVAMAKSFAVSAEQVEAAEKANQKWIEATTELNRTWREFAVDLAPAAAGFLNDFLIPASKWVRDLFEGLEKAADAQARLTRKGSGGASNALQEFKDALPSGLEAGPAIFTAWKMQGDAWREMGRRIDNSIADLVGTPRSHGLRLFSDSHLPTHPDDTAAGQFLNELNRPAPPGPPPESGVVSRWVSLARSMRQAEEVMNMVGGAGALAGQSPLAGFLRTLSGIRQDLFIGRGDAGPWQQALDGVGQLADSIRGGFGGSMLGQQFARGERVAEEQLDALRDIRDEVGDLNEKATPLVFG